jgi:hypothetical protein
MPENTNRLGMTKKEEAAAIAERIGELVGAGMVVAVDPDIADLMGAFEETALSPEDARDAQFDGELVEENE